MSAVVGTPADPLSGGLFVAGNVMPTPRRTCVELSFDPPRTSKPSARYLCTGDNLHIVRRFGHYCPSMRDLRPVLWRGADRLAHPLALFRRDGFACRVDASGPRRVAR